MLYWFARRLKEVQEKDKTGQGGFTLIELLVVIIIIGILAAIAIPTFLNQRTKGYEATAKADLRSAVTFEEAYNVKNDAYAAVGAAGLTALKAEGYRQSADTTVTTLTPNGTAGGFCVSAKHNSGGATFYASDTNRTPSTTACS